MPRLEPVRLHHAQAVLAFELANRAFFTTAISDRGDAYFAEFAERYNQLIEGQEAGTGAFFVLVDDDAAVLGRFNLTFGPDEGAAELGYRVAEHVQGRGVATATVRELCRLAATCYGVRVVRAAVSDANVASQRVLIKAGFARTGRAQPQDLGGKAGDRYALELPAPEPTDRQPRPDG